MGDRLKDLRVSLISAYNGEAKAGQFPRWSWHMLHAPCVSSYLNDPRGHAVVQWRSWLGSWRRFVRRDFNGLLLLLLLWLISAPPQELVTPAALQRWHASKQSLRARRAECRFSFSRVKLQPIARAIVTLGMRSLCRRCWP